MGLWWKKVDATPPEEGCAVFEGDPKALSKRWPILWRFHQRWAHIYIGLDMSEMSGYILYFESGGTVMRYRRTLRTVVVFARIGPDPVRFWAIDANGQPLKAAGSTLWIQPCCRRDTLSPEELVSRRLIERFHRVTYV